MTEATGIAILIETALLGQGLASISDREMLENWEPGQEPAVHLVWMEQGQIIKGQLPAFLVVRGCPDMQRIDGKNLAEAREKGQSGFMTASAVMRSALAAGTITVTAGMGGIREQRISDDLHCLASLPVVLVASAPKDVFDLDASLQYLFQRGVRVHGWQSVRSDGFIFRRPPVDIPVLDLLLDLRSEDTGPGRLILNPVSTGDRWRDNQMLLAALASGHAAEQRGEPFHPAVNAELDRMSAGRSSQIQLQALMRNIKIARHIRQRIEISSSPFDFTN